MQHRSGAAQYLHDGKPDALALARERGSCRGTGAIPRELAVRTHGTGLERRQLVESVIDVVRRFGQPGLDQIPERGCLVNGAMQQVEHFLQLHLVTCRSILLVYDPELWRRTGAEVNFVLEANHLLELRFPQVILPNQWALVVTCCRIEGACLKDRQRLDFKLHRFPRKRDGERRVRGHEALS